MISNKFGEDATVQAKNENSESFFENGQSRPQDSGSPKMTTKFRKSAKTRLSQISVDVKIQNIAEKAVTYRIWCLDGPQLALHVEDVAAPAPWL